MIPKARSRLNSTLTAVRQGPTNLQGRSKIKGPGICSWWRIRRSGNLAAKHSSWIRSSLILIRLERRMPCRFQNKRDCRRRRYEMASGLYNSLMCSKTPAPAVDLVDRRTGFNGRGNPHLRLLCGRRLSSKSSRRVDVTGDSVAFCELQAEQSRRI